MIHQSCVVADSKLHANAIIGWMNLDPGIWIPISYGDRISQAFDHVKIVRPLSGVTEAHLSWLSDVLLPSIARRRDTIPHFWEPTGSLDHDEEPHPGFSTMW